MTTTLCILGRQPDLGLAELESLYGADNLEPLGRQAALLSVDPQTLTHRLMGGTIKVAEVISVINTTAWPAVVRQTTGLLMEYIAHLSDGKLTIGLSAYGMKVSAQSLTRSALELKKQVRQTGHPVRIVPNTETALNSAQVWHNRLTDTLGIELLFAADRGRTYVARTISIQDVDAYSARDFSRPRRDARVGMLPPKLAQVMINLAHPSHGATILDPFCGTGVVLMEAALYGYSLLGSDLNEKMIDYTRTNLSWLADTANIRPAIIKLETADATCATWPTPITHVVTETYLGRPLASLPDTQTLQTIIRDCNTIITAFLKNLQPQLQLGSRCCIAVPAWKTPRGFIHLPVVDYLKKIGYNRVSFSHVDQNDLLYYREDQIVARELLVLTR